ncbi:MAG: hypothetical protein ACRDRA_17525 [Pseudonocardiaceae bacterium]
MSQRSDWQELRSRRTTELGATDAYNAARLAFELGRRGTGAPRPAGTEPD